MGYWLKACESWIEVGRTEYIKYAYMAGCIGPFDEEHKGFKGDNGIEGSTIDPPDREWKLGLEVWSLDDGGNTTTQPMSYKDFGEMVQMELIKGYLEKIDGEPVTDEEARAFIEKLRAEAAKEKRRCRTISVRDLTLRRTGGSKRRLTKYLSSWKLSGAGRTKGHGRKSG